MMKAWRGATKVALGQSNAESSSALKDAARENRQFWKGTTTCLARQAKF
jgi:cytochrome c peroxidase